MFIEGLGMGPLVVCSRLRYLEPRLTPFGRLGQCPKSMEDN